MTSMVEVKVEGQQIVEMAQRVAQVLDDVDPGTAYIVCLFMASVLMNPSMEPEGIQNIIKETSRYMHMLDMPNEATDVFTAEEVNKAIS